MHVHTHMHTHTHMQSTCACTCRRQLSEAAARGEPPQCVLFRQQREYLESKGLEQDFGMQQVWTIPALTLTRALTLALTLALIRPLAWPSRHPHPNQVWTIPARFTDDKDEMRLAHKRLRELCEVSRPRRPSNPKPDPDPNPDPDPSPTLTLTLALTPTLTPALP